ncbi:MAG: hypothetical protein HYX75_01410 [Acidobacteria bacterium]|nr:hypothetical protein [Acidobacteriota bacterium]
MPQAESTEDQIMALIDKLPPTRRRLVLLALAKDAAAGRDERMQRAQGELRRLAHDRGLDWDRMTEDEREALADDLTHEDRECSS